MTAPDRYFSWLLRLLPAPFRERHGAELHALVARMKDALGPQPGRIARGRFYLALTWDLLRHVVPGGDGRAVQRAGLPRAGRSGWRDALAMDTRFAVRQFRHRWGTSLTMVAVLSLGLSVCILLFSYVHAYAGRRPSGITAAADLVRIRGIQTDRGLAGRAFAADEFDEYRQLTGQFSAVAGWADALVSIEAPGVSESSAPTRVSFVTENYFSVLGVRPMLGPGFPAIRPGDSTLGNVAVIAHTVWDGVLGRDPDVIGKTLTVNGAPVTIVGVTAPRFVGVGAVSERQIWLPLPARHALLAASSADSLSFRSIARISPGVSLAAADGAVEAVAARAAQSLARQSGAQARTISTDVVPITASNLDPNAERDVVRLTVGLGGLGLLALLITCTNVSALMTGLAVARRREIAVRLSLGAARTRIVRQLITESSLLAILAGAGALVIAWMALDAVATAFPWFPLDVGVTWTATAFTFATALTVGVLFGLAPALHATRITLAGALQSAAATSTGTRLRLQRALVVAQVAFTQPLVVGIVAVLLFVFANLGPGMRTGLTDHLIDLRLTPTAAVPSPLTQAASSSALQTEVRLLREVLASSPGVEVVVPADAAIARELGSFAVHPDDRIADGFQEDFRVSGRTTAPGFLSAVGIPLLRGRDFTVTDATIDALDGQGVLVPVIVENALAQRLWPGVDPLGRRLRAATPADAGSTLVVTGVVSNTTERAPDVPRLYLAQDPATAPLALVVRTTGDAESMLASVRALARQAAPSLTADVQTVAALEDARRTTFAQVTTGLTGLGVATVFLSAIGLYAVVAFSVGQRTGEIAVRMAVGASARRVAASVLIDGVRLGAVGMALGLPVSLAGLVAWNAIPDPDFPTVPLAQVTMVVAFVVMLTAAAATFIPARRAAAVDPMRALREQ